jgi:hypothetical protein
MSQLNIRLSGPTRIFLKKLTDVVLYNYLRLVFNQDVLFLKFPDGIFAPPHIKKRLTKHGSANSLLHIIVEIFDVEK